MAGIYPPGSRPTLLPAQNHQAPSGGSSNALLVSKQPVDPDRLERWGATDPLADARPDARIAVEGAHQNADLVRVPRVDGRSNDDRQSPQNHFSQPAGGFQVRSRLSPETRRNEPRAARAFAAPVRRW